jgi:hypothetical protein
MPSLRQMLREGALLFDEIVGVVKCVGRVYGRSGGLGECIVFVGFCNSAVRFPGPEDVKCDM